jgi:hypothetical protein
METWDWNIFRIQDVQEPIEFPGLFRSWPGSWAMILLMTSTLGPSLFLISMTWASAFKWWIDYLVSLLGADMNLIKTQISAIGHPYGAKGNRSIWVWVVCNQHLQHTAEYVGSIDASENAHWLLLITVLMTNIFYSARL